MLRHSMLQLRSVVIFDIFVFWCPGCFWLVRILACYYVIDIIGTYNFWVCCVGLGAWSVVNFSRGSLCVWRFPLHYLGYTLEWSLVFGARLCWGGG